MLQRLKSRSDQIVAKFPWLPYVVPFGIFFAFTAVQNGLPVTVEWLYPAKTIVVGLSIVMLLPWFPSLQRSHTVSSTLVGLLVCVLWVATDDLYPHLMEAQEFDPTAVLAGPSLCIWIGFRLFGAVVVVAVMEEVFWRGFLLRWIIKQDFLSVSFGTFTWVSFAVTSILFAVEHNRWFAGLLAGVIYNLWFYRTCSIYACIVAHGVTNLALGLYVLYSGDWSFW